MPFSLTSAQLADAGAGAGVSFQVLVINTINATSTADIWGDATVTSLTVANDSTPSATPLPSSWLMLLGGLGSLGFLLIAKRQPANGRRRSYARIIY
jgi:hypothetical protein